MGRTIRSKTLIAETGLPGSPKTALFPTTPRIVGLPGLIAKPCVITPGVPSSLTMVEVRSLELTELPAEIINMSASSRLSWAAFLS